MSDLTPSRMLSKKLGGRNIYLVGMMGSGKSVTGPILAKQLRYKFLDADSAIEKLSQKSIPEIFADDGESNFREIETKVLESIGQFYSLVVSTGGGVVKRPKNWGILHQGIVVWIDPGRERLLERLNKDSVARPLLETSNPVSDFDALYEERKPLYAESDLHIFVENESPEDVAWKIIKELPLILNESVDPTLSHTIE